MFVQVMGRRLGYVDFNHQGGYLGANKGIDVVVYMYSTEQADEQDVGCCIE